MQRNKIIVWAIGALMHLMLSGEEPWSIYGSSNTILDLLAFNKQTIPYLRVPSFPISNNIRNADLRILLRNCLERNQIKRVFLGNLEQSFLNYLTKLLIHDLNFDFYDKQLYRKGINNN
jgi:serine/threonine protein kinase